MKNRERILITSALPYANGDIHLGYLVEAVMTDAWARFQRMRGHEVVYVCASDAHGTPIELKALELGKPPEEIADGYRQAHHRDLTDFGIELDAYHTTHSDETRKHVYAIYEAAKAKGLIYQKEVEGIYSPQDKRFLPDRFVRGTCPRCKTPDQYGDSCENCGFTYTPVDLIDPRSAISGGKVETRKSRHYFYKLSDTRDFLKSWVNTDGRTPAATRQFLREWLEDLRDWDISRDAPYFGFPIPGEPEKYFYVWLDAPVGYIGATEKYCQSNGRSAEEFWKDDETRIVHVIGKDIVRFHCLFWPSVLHTAGYNLPSRVQVHGFLTVNNAKMSKSRGTFINARTYVKHLHPEYLRFYFASKLRSEPSDLDLNVGVWANPDDPESLDASQSEFVERVNAEFVNNLVNFSSRVIQFVNKRFDNRLGQLPPEAAAVAERIQAEVAPGIAKAFEGFDLARGMRAINELALEANKYFQDSEPWKVIKEDPDRAREICTLGANYVKVLTIFLKPIVPEYAARVEKALAVEPLTWEDIRFDLEDCTIGQFETLVTRIDPNSVKAMVLESRVQSQPEDVSASEAGKPVTPIKAEIDIEEFLKVDLRVAKVLEANKVEGADKLVQLRLDLGEGEPRSIFAGIKKHYDPDSLVGRRIIVVANLKPRKMRFGVSQGMLLAASDGDDVLLLGVDQEPAPGSTVS